jgi:hypothetical protein
MTICSNPPGAKVYVDGYEVGTTPASTGLTYYGTRLIRLVRDGYETLTVMQPIPAPWYQIPPIDFVAENLLPWEIRDQRAFTYQMIPQRVVPMEEVMHRGEDLRRRARSSGIVVSTPPRGGATGPPEQTGGAPTAPGLPFPGGMPVHPLPSREWTAPSGMGPR